LQAKGRRLQWTITMNETEDANEARHAREGKWFRQVALIYMLLLIAFGLSELGGIIHL